MLNENDYVFGPFNSLEGFHGRCDFSLSEGVVKACFDGGEDSYIVNFELSRSAMSVGVKANVLFNGWKKVQYVAIGYSTPSGFRHLKIKNIRQDYWVSIGFTHHDIIWLLQNGAGENDPAEIGNIRLFIKGEPIRSGARVEIRQLQLQLNPYSNALQTNESDRGALQDVLYEHLNHALRNYEANATAYMQTGNYPMPGNKLLNWPKLQRLPTGLNKVSTYRSVWHAQHLPINLLQLSKKTGRVAPLFAAKSLIENWLENSFFKTDADLKYAWYDHGTAERQLAFILIWFKALELQMEKRFLERLGEAILQQARLLDSEAFYAYHQPLRYHNHAWFQDAALLATGLAFNHHPEAANWITNAISRFEDQLDTLIVRDGGYAIFVENSIGYHHGVQSLAQLVGKLVTLSGRESEIPIVAQELVAWSDFLRYPDGHAPAQGDTFRLPPRTGDAVRRGDPWAEPGCTILPKAGYAVVKGNHGNKPWMLCLFNTSLSTTHKHEDNCSITFWFDGVEWLADPSFYSHEYEKEIPKYLRSAAAHNCVSIPGKEYLMGLGQTRLAGKVEGDRFYIKASHGCYDGLEVVREISGCLTEIDLKIIDQIVGGLNVGAQQSLVVSEGVDLREATDFFEIASKESSSTLNVVHSGAEGFEISMHPIGTTFMQSNLWDKLTMHFSGALQMRIVASSQHPVDSISSETTTREPVAGVQKSEPRLMNYKKSNCESLKNKKVAIIGSCVTRDIMQYLQPKEIKYFARTGFVSLASSPIKINEDLINVKGDFEKRMVLSDFDKRALDELRDFEPDVLFLDFIDERFDLVKISGSYVTNSNYLIQSGALSAFDGYELVDKREAHGLWCLACDKIMDELLQLGCEVVLHKAWWAERYMDHDSGRIKSFSPEERQVALLINQQLDKYYSYLLKRFDQVAVVEAKEELVYSDFAHKWGRDFFHYSDRYYIYLASAIRGSRGEFDRI